MHRVAVGTGDHGGLFCPLQRNRPPLSDDYPHKELITRVLADTCDIYQQPAMQLRFSNICRGAGDTGPAGSSGSHKRGGDRFGVDDTVPRRRRGARVPPEIGRSSRRSGRGRLSARGLLPKMINFPGLSETWPTRRFDAQ